MFIYLFVKFVNLWFVNFAEYGVEQCIPLSNLKSEEVLKKVQEIASQK